MLIQQLNERHPEERGFTLPTLNRRIGQLVKIKKIGIIKKEDFSLFGIVENDANASYLISQSNMDKKHHFDDVISDIPKGTREEVFTALQEILLYQSNNRLTPKQIDQVATALKYDDKIVLISLEILNEAVFLHQVHPQNEELFKNKLKKLILKIRENNDYRIQIRQIINILGYLEDDFVIDQLEYDVQLVEFNTKFFSDYMNGILIPVIEKNRLKLYELEKSFIKQGKDHAALNIHMIRDRLINSRKYGLDDKGWTF
jgi:hypothetical protein